MEQKPKFENQKLKTSYISVVISMSLVLFMLGLLGTLFMSATQVSNKLKEQFTVHVFLKKNSSDAEIKTLKKTLKIAEYTKSLKYISTQEASQEYIETTGENFVDFLGDNPILSSLNITVKADFVNPEKMKNLTAEIQQNDIVEEVAYQKEILDNYFSKLEKLSYWILAITALLLIVFMALINASVRLSIYAKRFTIRTMQLVGATRKFIQKPFLQQSVLLGLISSLIAIALLSFVLYYSFKQIELIESVTTGQYISLAMLYFTLIICGISMAYVSTYFATQRFLKLKTDQLY